MNLDLGYVAKPSWLYFVINAGTDLTYVKNVQSYNQ